MTFRDAIIKVLRSASGPMTTQEVVSAVLSSGKVETSGKTPDRTIGALLYSMARSPNNPGVRRIAKEGKSRAVRDSVRWVWDPTGKESSARAV